MPRSAQKTPAASGSTSVVRRPSKARSGHVPEDSMIISQPAATPPPLASDIRDFNPPAAPIHDDAVDATVDDDESMKDEDEDEDVTVADNTYESDLEKEEDDPEDVDEEEEEDDLEGGSDVEDDLIEEEEEVADDDAPGDTTTAIEADDENATTFIGTVDNAEGDEPAEAEYTDYSMGKRDTKMNAAETQARLVSKCRNMLGLKKKSKRKPTIESELDFDNAYLPDDR